MLRMRFCDSTGGPRVASMFSKCGMPWFITVRSQVPNSQRGWVAASQATRGVSTSGTWKPLRMLFSRLAETGTSAVTTKVS